MTPMDQWARYRKYLCDFPSIGLRLDVSRMNFDHELFDRMAVPLNCALGAMEKLEAGAEANTTERRRVGHYWLRAPHLAPEPEIGAKIEKTIRAIRGFADGIATGAIKPPGADAFYILLIIGIGGSALGPQLLCDALGDADDPLLVRFLDNTDPDGIDRTLLEIGESLSQTLVLVISKSGGTRETRNAMLEVMEAYRRAGLEFAPHAVAVTCEDSALHHQATEEKWLATFPIWDWVGGRTSITSAVGLLPAAILGIDTDEFLCGARESDELNRNRDVLKNPAALLALMWHHAGGGRGDKNMVILPYADRLALFGRYAQQLIMESLGKERDRAGKVVRQGLTVFGNKGSTDQHAFVQQLRDGRDDFFVTFLDIQLSRRRDSINVEPDMTSGDYLRGFLYGTREALSASGRESITLTLDRVDAKCLGALIALFERAVGLYSEWIDVNAYDQPGVEAGKKAAESILNVQRHILRLMKSSPAKKRSAEEVAADLGMSEHVETVHHVLEHLSADSMHGIVRIAGSHPSEAKYVRAL